MPVYFFGGINGAGKTTIIENITRTMPHIEAVHTTSMFMDWVGLEAGDYNGLRNLPSDYKVNKNREMLTHYLQKVRPSENIILDSHYLTLINGKVSKVINGEWPQWLTALVLVDASVEIIYERIMNDNSFRDRSLFPSDSEHKAVLANYRNQTYDEFNHIAKKFNLPAIVLQNEADINVPVAAFLEFTKRCS